jgi:hypothetical protein
MTETVEGVWKEVYYKPAQEAKQKVPETTDSEPLRKKHFTFRYWITKDSTWSPNRNLSLVAARWSTVTEEEGREERKRDAFARCASRLYLYWLVYATASYPRRRPRGASLSNWAH